ncbi:recombinase family protein [Chitinophaga tropicalis]|uniref:Recombinase domain-containing protein n=1 Tax=Chitinophaga tropicalis TaxID=2683588 RepID=A0A7K1U562_9BACT|nr:recombinase family protein [Chitinophaga tropicalis]MVT09504.1 hypothetical protein [Chitinophaga tropicalis]
MKTDINLFSQFGVKQKHTKPLHETPYVVTLTRVSTKKQLDGMSIENQNKYFKEHAERTGKIILESFGGTHESAKTDKRKEFQKMLAFVKKNNAGGNSKKISEIWVYMIDRFSRSGAGGIGIAKELREKYGVAIYAIAQPVSVKDDSGVYFQEMQFLQSNYENKVRRRRMIDGMTGKFEKGDWVTRVPQGYSVIKEGKQRTIVVNEVGKKIRQAFIWKSEGMKNEEIIKRLRGMGVKMYKQQLTKIFKKPFYCGLINHGLLDGRVVQGNHEPLISQELFLKVNDIHISSPQYGVPHERENKYLPLKIHVRCDVCLQPMTGYARKKKTRTGIIVIYYYKCRTNGCCCNKNADQLHESYGNLLGQYGVKEPLIPVIFYELSAYFNEITKDIVAQEASLKVQLTEINKKIDAIEERYYALGEMSKDTFEKFHSRYQDERLKISKLLQQCANSISTHKEDLFDSVAFSRKLLTVWDSCDVGDKEILQNLLFSEGVLYNRKNGTLRPKKVNFIFELMARQVRDQVENLGGRSKSCFFAAH